MKYTLLILMVLSMFLTSCSSKPAEFYVFTPLAPTQQKTTALSGLTIGIDDVHTPAYLDKNQFPINLTAHELQLEDFHLWAESVNKNFKRVIRTNLATLLPGAVVQVAPWDSKFKPNHHLQIFINQFTVSKQGNTVLEAEYMIYHDQQLTRKRTVKFTGKASSTSVDAMVISLNHLLNQLTQDIAGSLKG